ncbi:MAG: asparagine synthetase B, partial [Betaproteobacteria bacterium]|nr:asparagine synthetase B [Betaproteobacteria bacterium]
MCGIYGIIDTTGAPVDSGWLTAMGNITRHRGPDDQGLHADGPLRDQNDAAVDHRSGGRPQPIANKTRRCWLVCNGEIYNFRELRGELEAAGHRFRTVRRRDPAAPTSNGATSFVGRLNGMFGFALWDAARRRLLVGRDRLEHQAHLPSPPGRAAGISRPRPKPSLTLPGFTPRVDPTAL